MVYEDVVDKMIFMCEFVLNKFINEWSNKNINLSYIELINNFLERREKSKRLRKNEKRNILKLIIDSQLIVKPTFDRISTEIVDF
jgi:hypothetical protein